MLPFTSLDAATEVGPGAVKDLEGSFRHHTMIVNVTGAPTQVSVNLVGSHDGEHWASLGHVGGGILSAEGLVRYVRADVTILTGGTAPTVFASIASAP